MSTPEILDQLLTSNPNAPAQKGEILLLRAEMKSEFREVNSKITVLQTDVATLKTDVATLKTDMIEVKGSLEVVKELIGALHRDVTGVATQMAELLKK